MRYYTHPLEQQYNTWDQDFKDKKYRLWKLLKTLNTEYLSEYTGYYEPSVSGKSDSFDVWVEEKYGIRIFNDLDGNILGISEVVDEAKYAWCLLKHN